MGTAAIISLVAALGSLGYNIYKGYVDRNKLAKSSKEAMSYQDALEDENAQDAYDRQVEFQENYLTPAAQLKSQAAGYDAIGLNRMLLAGSQPGASAATAPQASASGQGQVPLPSMEGLASMLGTAIDAKRLNSVSRFRRSRIRLIGLMPKLSVCVHKLKLNSASAKLRVKISLTLGLIISMALRLQTRMLILI